MEKMIYKCTAFLCCVVFALYFDVLYYDAFYCKVLYYANQYVTQVEILEKIESLREIEPIE